MRHSALAREAGTPRPVGSRPVARVLVVEDDAELREWLVASLRDEQLPAAAAGSAREALELVRTLRPSVVLTDKNLPDFSGLELVRRARVLAPECEFVVMSGDASIETAIDAVNLGVVGYLQKPLASIGDVTRRVRTALDRSRLSALQRELAARVTQLGAELESARVELALMANVVGESRREAALQVRTLLDEVLDPLAVLDEDAGAAASFAERAASGANVVAQARAEAGRLRMLQQVVRGLHERATAVARSLERVAEGAAAANDGPGED